MAQQRALTIKEAVYGPEHPAVAITLGNLGIADPTSATRTMLAEASRWPPPPTCLAFRRDVVADDEDLLHLASRAEYDDSPPPGVATWLADAGVSV